MTVEFVVEFAVGDYVSFGYHDKHREGTVHRVGDGFIVLENGLKSGEYRTYRIDKMADVYHAHREVK